MSLNNQLNKLSVAAAVRRDFFPSIVVFLVALPLCLGIAIASGAPPAAGLITGIVGGLVVGWITGSPLQVSGPAAGLTVIVYDLIQKYELPLVMLVIVVAGLIQITAGAFKLGQWFRAVSPAVIQGMLAGIGVLIFSSQFHIMADDPPRGGSEIWGIPISGGLTNLVTIPETLYHVFIPMDGSTHQMAALIGVMTISIIVLWKMFAPHKLRLLPGPLLGIVIATLVAVGFNLPIAELKERIPENFVGSLMFPDWSLWASAPWQGILLSAAGLAAVASAETLLCATAVDRMHQGVRTNYDRELMAQGVGNTVCGLIGGLPMTGVIVRSSANVESGGKSRASTIMHSCWLLLFVAAVPFLLRSIPVCSLAAVLVYIGYKLVNPAAIKRLARYGNSEVVIYFVTLSMIVITDLLTGVITGIVLAAIKLLYTFSHLDIQQEDNPETKKTTLHLNGTATFVRLPVLAAALERVPADRELHVQMDSLKYVDHACLELLMAWETQHQASGGKLVIDWQRLTAKFEGLQSDAQASDRDGEYVSTQTQDATPVPASLAETEVASSVDDTEREEVPSESATRA